MFFIESMYILSHIQALRHMFTHYSFKGILCLIGCVPFLYAIIVCIIRAVNKEHEANYWTFTDVIDISDTFLGIYILLYDTCNLVFAETVETECHCTVKLRILPQSFIEYSVNIYIVAFIGSHNLTLH